MPLRELVYLGNWPGMTAKVVTVMLPREKLDGTGEWDISILGPPPGSMYFKKLPNFRVVGGVYNVEMPTPEKIVASSARFLRLYERGGIVSELQAGHLGRERERMAKERLKTLEKDAGLLESLSEAREAYKKARGVHRAQVLAAFVAYITGG